MQINEDSMFQLTVGVPLSVSNCELVTYRNLYHIWRKEIMLNIPKFLLIYFLTNK